MCYDISFQTDIELLSSYFPDLIFDDQLSLDFDMTHIMGHAYNVHPIIYRHQEDQLLHLRSMEWGCIPYYVDDEGKFLPQRKWMLNARSERILNDRKSYWYKIRNRRCLIPMVGIYEHRKIAGWKKKVPYFVKPKDQDMFFVPGLYSVANLPDKTTGEILKRWTYTMLTRNANDTMKRIHNDGENKWRMPLFLPFEMSMKWLAHELSDEDYNSILDYEIPSQDLYYHTVDTIRSSKSRPDGLPKDAPFVWENLPALEMEPV